MTHKKALLLVLQTIYKRDFLERLVNSGIEYCQIVHYLNYALEQMLIFDTGEKLVLTEKGHDFLSKENPSDKWILSLEDYRIRKSEIFEIFLPKTDIVNNF